MEPMPRFAQHAGDTKWLDNVEAHPGTPYTNHTWAIAFTCSQDWQAINDHLDQQLKPLGYLLATRQATPDQYGFVKTEYVDAAYKAIISVNEISGIYLLKAIVYDQSQDPRVMPIFTHGQPIP